METFITFLKDLADVDITGVAFKNLQLKKQILIYFANEGDATIADLAKHLNSSSPKVNDLITELITDGLVKDYGKTESGVGRKPNLYGLEPKSIYFVGVDIKMNHINIGLLDLKKNLLNVEERIPYQLTNTREALNHLCDIIEEAINKFPVSRERIVGIGVNLSGRINYRNGYSYSYFHFDEEPLSKVMEKRSGIRTYIENDSRAVAYGEFSSGIVTHEKDVLFVNIEHGIGMGIFINGQLYYGKSGFSGDLAHTPMYNNEIICHCGKRGCLETEASGYALIRLLKQKMENGASSILSADHKDYNNIQLEDIIEAARKEDTLCIELLAEIGENLGKGIAVIINLFNPELVILGGSLAATGDYIRLPIKSAINKYSLTLVNNDTKLKMSKIGERAGIIGACLLVRDRTLGLFV
ncbi:ROK family transcriptional regulator [Flavitalea sp.]|nr:ROK family transcriptional regulator [Flavitalea sp.]